MPLLLPKKTYIQHELVVASCLCTGKIPKIRIGLGRYERAPTLSHLSWYIHGNHRMSMALTREVEEKIGVFFFNSDSYFDIIEGSVCGKLDTNDHYVVRSYLKSILSELIKLRENQISELHYERF